MTKENLKDKRVIAGTQAYLKAMPILLPVLLRLTGAKRALVLLDEASILDVNWQATVKYCDIADSLRVLNTIGEVSDVDGWISLHEALLDKSVEVADIRRSNPPGSALAHRWQRQGTQLFGPQFRYLGERLATLTRSKRWRQADGLGITYAPRPNLENADVAVFAALAPVSLARHRLGIDLQEFQPMPRFLHEGTRVFNLKSSAGAAKYFRRNSAQVLFVVAQLIVQFAEKGKRCLLVSKKKFLALVVSEVEKYLAELSDLPFHVYPAGNADLDVRFGVPVLTYGTQGINRFEDFHVAIACNSYVMREDALGANLNDGYAPNEQIEISFGIEGGRRTARVVGKEERAQGFDQLVRAYQEHHEAGIAEQVLARVRFATKPRDVFFFQSCAPRFSLTNEFSSIASLRTHFGLSTRRQWQANRGQSRALSLSKLGWSAERIANELQMGLRTVQRHLSAATKPLKESKKVSWRGRETDS